MRIPNFIPCLITGLTLCCGHGASASPASPTAPKANLNSSEAMERLDTHYKAARQWGRLARNSSRPGHLEGLIIGDISRYVESQADILNCLYGFESIVAESHKIKDAATRTAILETVLRQYLMAALKLENHMNARAQSRKITPELKDLFDGADERCQAIHKFCIHRLSALVKAPGLKKQLDEAVLNALTKMGIN